jgi:hypothetical protein
MKLQLTDRKAGRGVAAEESAFYLTAVGAVESPATYAIGRELGHSDNRMHPWHGSFE